jgi:LysR family transcriptional regulator, transcriptional activator of nhaA
MGPVDTSYKSNIINRNIEKTEHMAAAGTLNFKHLRYFWAVARSGSIARASGQLHVTPQSISGQLAELEGSLGVELFRRAGRGLELTEGGRRILGYADEIFGLELELIGAARGAGTRVAAPYRVGIADSVPKSLAWRVVEPALRLEIPVRLVCREGRLAALLADLAVHRLDIVIADRPMPTDLNVRAYDHRLGASDLTIFGAAALISGLTGDFPAMLDGAPFLMPGEGVAIRRGLERWFDAARIRPRIVGEFDDSALMKAFGQGGAGCFAAPSAMADYVCRHYGVQAIGRVEQVMEELYAITTERRLQHPATVAVSRAASRDLFGTGTPGGGAPPGRRRSVSRS